jgi:hypothetical protein
VLFNSNFQNNFENKETYPNLTNYILDCNIDNTLTTNITNFIFNTKVINRSELSLTNKKPIIPEKSLYSSFNQSKSSSIALYSKDNLKKLYELLNMILKNFAIGKKAYIQRDFGCFSIDRDTNKNISNYNVRNYEKKEEFYTLNYPSFIEVILNRKTNNYNSKTRVDLYYNENQYSDIPLSMTTSSQNVLSIFKMNNLDAITMDVAIRLLLIPSKDVNEISGINLKDPTKFNQRHYKKLSQLFAKSFYTTSRNQLEKRLDEILNSNINKKKINVLNNTKLQPKHMLDLLLEKQLVNGTFKLVNIDAKNVKMIYTFYEFIMIMLKLKFYDYAITHLSNLQTEDITSPSLKVGGGSIERKLIGTINATAKQSFSKLSQKHKSYHKSEHLTPKKHKKTKSKQKLNEANKNKKTKHLMKL